MNRATVYLKHVALLVVVVAVGTATIAPLGRVTAAPVAAPVIVTNTPLPVQGTVNALQGGPFDVSINNVPRVTVANSPDVHVASLPIVQPFQAKLCSNPSSLMLCFDSPELPPSDPTPYRFFVPSGQRLVIEYVSGACDSTDADAVVLTTSASGSAPMDHFVPIAHMVDSPRKPRIGVLTRIYADPGTEVSMTVKTPASFPLNVTCRVVVSGNLMPMP